MANEEMGKGRIGRTVLWKMLPHIIWLPIDLLQDTIVCFVIY
jgi:hypothetical protein